MATNLPTISVEDAQLAVLVEAFTDDAGYKEWLRGALRAEVRARKITEITAASIASRNEEVEAYLDGLTSIAPPASEPEPTP